MIIQQTSEAPKSFYYSICWNTGDQTGTANGQYIHRTNLNGRYKCKIINIQLTNILRSSSDRNSATRVSLISRTFGIYPERNNKDILGTFSQAYSGRPLDSIDFFQMSSLGQFYAPIDLGVINIEGGQIDVAIKTAVNTAPTFRQACLELELEPVPLQYEFDDFKLPEGVEIPLYTRQIPIVCDGTINNVNMSGVRGKFMMRIVQAYMSGSMDGGYSTTVGIISISSPNFLIENGQFNLGDATGRANTRGTQVVYFDRFNHIGWYMDKFEIPIEIVDKFQFRVYDVENNVTNPTTEIVLHIELYPYIS